MSAPFETGLPATTRQAIRQEFRRTFRPPFETPITVASNAALMSSLWFFLPAWLKDNVFTLHGSLLFAVVLSAWMYADVPATNILGPDAPRVIAAIDDPAMLGRLMEAKSIVLWSLVTPVCLVASVIIGLASHDILVTLYSGIWIVVVPFGVLGISAWVGIWFPYHPMPIRYRLAHRKPIRQMIWRWIILITTPYMVVPLLGGVLMLPSLLIWGFTAPKGLTKELPHHDLGVGVAIVCVLAALGSVLGRRFSILLIHRRRDKLREFLSDPTLG